MEEIGIFVKGFQPTGNRLGVVGHHHEMSVRFKKNVQAGLICHDDEATAESGFDVGHVGGSLQMAGREGVRKIGGKNQIHIWVKPWEEILILNPMKNYS